MAAVSQEVTYDEIAARADHTGLLVMGALHPGPAGAAMLDSGTLILLGAGPEFWPAFTQAPEWSDGKPDPVDRWSSRVIGTLAAELGANPHFPFGGPPYTPFIDWAQKSGRAHKSPTGMLVHDTVGLMISYRGALHFPRVLPLPETESASPCTSCPAPCLTACPVAALSENAPYDLASCHSFLDSPTGQDCMMMGCAARRACPLSSGAGRDPAQSALHMKAFHPS